VQRIFCSKKPKRNMYVKSDDIYPKKLNSASFHTVITYFESSLFHFSWVELLLLNTFRWAAKSGRVVVTFIKAKIYMQ
jgi:hypothetical protein